MRFLLLAIPLLPFFLCASEPPEKGTLIVTYQTDNRGERLDRTRFWLKNEEGKETLYPRGSAYVADPENHTRMVVIEDLPPGTYTLDFAVPNTDSYFLPPPVREIKIVQGEVVKINQEIKEVKNFPPEPLEDVEEIPKVEEEVEAPPPAEENDPPLQEEPEAAFGKLIVSFDEPAMQFRIISDEGSITTHPNNETDTVISLDAGKMVLIPKLAAGTYTLEFFRADSGEVLNRKTVEIRADRTKSLHQPLHRDRT